MIIGVGSDIVKITRIEKLLVHKKQAFLKRIFTSAEIKLLETIKDSQRAISYVAKRFAAKEAFSKALGTGIGKYVSFQDLEIFSALNKKPYFSFSVKLQNFLQEQYGNSQTHLSITDEKHYAQAFVIIEKVI